MRLHSESNPALNTVTAYGHDYIEINRVAYGHAIWFAPEGDIHTWDIDDVAGITPDTLKSIAGLDSRPRDPMAFLDGAPASRPDDAPEVMLVGTGSKQRFLAPEITRPLLHAGIGIEIMTTQAAARTYNILMAEGRRVVAALLPNEETE